MLETQEARGFWWLPESADTKLAGTLTITKGDPSLALLGHFGHKILSEDGNQRAYSWSLAERPRIHGMTETGKEVTLERHGVANWGGNFPGVQTSVYQPEFALVGKLFAEEEKVVFNEIAVELSDLNAWTLVSGFRTQISGGEAPETGFFRPTGTSVQFEAPDDVEITLDHGEHALIRFWGSSEGIRGGSDAITITQRAAFHIRFAAPVGLDDVVKRVGQIRNFLSLAVGRPVATVSVKGFQDDYPEAGRREPIEILFRMQHNPELPVKRRAPHEMLFALPNASPDISAVMRNWFAKQETLEPVFNLFFGVLYDRDLPLDVRFLLYAQAVETYDFRRRDPHELPRAEHKRRLAAIIDAAPEQWRDWLRMRLASSNYLTLDQRIRDVLGEFPEVASKLTGSTKQELDSFLASLKQSRNYYTHYTPSLKKKAATGAGLLVLFLQLQAMIEMSLLRELGFTCEAIDEILDRAGRYANIRHFVSVAAEDEERETDSS